MIRSEGKLLKTPASREIGWPYACEHGFKANPMERISKNLTLAWLFTLVLSVVIAVLSYYSGRASDCKPGQIDGQCGLSTFLGLVYGIGAGLTILVVVTVCLLVVAYRRRRTLSAGE